MNRYNRCVIEFAEPGWAEKQGIPPEPPRRSDHVDYFMLHGGHMVSARIDAIPWIVRGRVSAASLDGCIVIERRGAAMIGEHDGWKFYIPGGLHGSVATELKDVVCETCSEQNHLLEDTTLPPHSWARITVGGGFLENDPESVIVRIERTLPGQRIAIRPWKGGVLGDEMVVHAKFGRWTPLEPKEVLRLSGAPALTVYAQGEEDED